MFLSSNEKTKHFFPFSFLFQHPASHSGKQISTHLTAHFPSVTLGRGILNGVQRAKTPFDLHLRTSPWAEKPAQRRNADPKAVHASVGGASCSQGIFKSNTQSPNPLINVLRYWARKNTWSLFLLRNYVFGWIDMSVWPWPFEFLANFVSHTIYFRLKVVHVISI